jgi:hypothetical protein
MFCSVHCRNTANGKKGGGWNRVGLTRTCEECGTVFPVTPSRLTAQNTRACSRRCLGLIQSRERRGVFQVGEANPQWIDGRSPLYYRQFLRAECEWCGSSTRLVIHHTDEDRHNNRPENLVTLCRRCHQEHHAEPRRDSHTGQYV